MAFGSSIKYERKTQCVCGSTNGVEEYVSVIVVAGGGMVFDDEGEMAGILTDDFDFFWNLLMESIFRYCSDDGGRVLFFQRDTWWWYSEGTACGKPAGILEY